MFKKLLFGAGAVALAASLGANTAFAEPQGKAEMGNGLSACVWSGLNDDPSEPFPDDGYVQSYGQLVKKLGVDEVRAFAEFMGVQGLGIPGLECNPQRSDIPPYWRESPGKPNMPNSSPH